MTVLHISNINKNGLQWERKGITTWFLPVVEAETKGDAWFCVVGTSHCLVSRRGEGGGRRPGRRVQITGQVTCQGFIGDLFHNEHGRMHRHQPIARASPIRVRSSLSYFYTFFWFLFPATLLPLVRHFSRTMIDIFCRSRCKIDRQVRFHSLFTCHCCVDREQRGFSSFESVSSLIRDDS